VRAGREGGRMRKRGSRTRIGVYVSLRLVDTVWFLVRKVDPYYGKANYKKDPPLELYIEL
jgi:hypothetical protein